jgi:predicted Rossmann fold flavoprotein
MVSRYYSISSVGTGATIMTRFLRTDHDCRIHQKDWDVIVTGAGASGLMCAAVAGKRGRSVLVLDHSDRPGSKIRVSGGGCCNFTNRAMGSEHFISRNPHFATSALSRFTPAVFISLLEEHGIGYQEKEAGKLFCCESSREIVDMLISECRRASVKFLLNTKIAGVSKERGFSVSTNQGTFRSESLVVATGGLSYPNIGASNFGYVIARQFGVKVTKLSPALTPLRLNPRDAETFGVLSGISIDCTVSHKEASFRDKVLFTHTGLSGPAILQISSYWDEKDCLHIDLLPSVDIYGILVENRSSRSLLPTLLDRYLPKRFVRLWSDLHSLSKPLNRFSTQEFDTVAQGLHGWQVLPLGPEGFNKAEVTLGGVDTDELSSKTMEAKRIPGLYFSGEVIDVTGHLGGYNLHWAWASGHAAGQYV